MPKSSIADLPFQIENLNELDKEKVIDELMNLYSRQVYLLAYSYVKDQGIAEDISQEVFIKCFKHLDTFRGDAQIKSWIYRITVNTAKDFLRSKSFQLFKYPRSFFENLIKSKSSEDLFIKKDDNDHLLQAVLTLPTKYREVVFLYYFQDEKIEDIAGILKINHNTVKTRLSRARAFLKDIIKGDDLVGKGF